MEDIKNGGLQEFVDWYDESGNIINAGDGGIICVDGRYHWYGMALRPLPAGGGGKGGQTTCTGINMYGSDDLLHWEYEGVILPCSPDPNDALYGPMRFERPKIIYNRRTKKYVLWCHYVRYPGDHGFVDGSADAGVAVADRVDGPYRWAGYSRPIDDRGYVRDCTVFRDTDGRAYFIYDRHVSDGGWGGDRCLHVVELTEDYLGFTDRFARIGPCARREAPVMRKYNGWYYLITSGLTSWECNQARYFRAENIMGPWQDMGDPCLSDESHTTFYSQGTFMIEDALGSGQDIFMAERHNTENFLHCSYIWLPVHYKEDGSLEITYTKILKL